MSEWAAVLHGARAGAVNWVLLLLFLTQQSLRSPGQLRVGWSQRGSTGWSCAGSSGLTHGSGRQLMWAWLGWITGFCFLCLILPLGPVGQLELTVKAMTVGHESKSKGAKPFLSLWICYGVQILLMRSKGCCQGKKGRTHSLPSGKNCEVTWKMVLI